MSAAEERPVLPVWQSRTQGVLVSNGDTGAGFYALHANPGWTGRTLDELPADVVLMVPATDRPSPAQWAAWFRTCADMADPDELSDDHRTVFRLVAEHFESDHVVRKASKITGVDQ